MNTTEQPKIVVTGLAGLDLSELEARVMAHLVEDPGSILIIDSVPDDLLEKMARIPFPGPELPTSSRREHARSKGEKKGGRRYRWSQG